MREQGALLPSAERRAPLSPPPPLSQRGKWRVLWGGDQPPSASFDPHSLELRIRPLVPARVTWTGVRVFTVPNPNRGLALFLIFRGGGHQDSSSPMSGSILQLSAERSRAGGSAKGPGAVRFRGKGPQVGAAVAECERFRWEITGDNLARDGVARQETSSPRQLRAKEEGRLSVTAQQRVGQSRSVGQRPPL